MAVCVCVREREERERLCIEATGSSALCKLFLWYLSTTPYITWRRKNRTTGKRTIL